MLSALSAKVFYPTEVHYVATMCDGAAGHREDGGTGAFV